MCYCLTVTTNAFQSAIDRYLTFLEVEENKAAVTVSNYRLSLDLIAELIAVTQPEEINKHTVSALKRRLHAYRTKRGAKPLSLGTKNYHLTVLRAFLRYLIQEEEVDVMPPDRVRLFRQQPRQVKVWNDADMQRLLAAPDATTPYGQRDRAMLHLLFSTGLRLAELRALNRTDVNFTTREIAVRGKGGSVRVVFLSDIAATCVQEYLRARTDEAQPLFIRMSADADRITGGEELRISRSWIYKLVKRYIAEAGIVTGGSPHTIRHSFATNLLRNGADLRSVQESLGHKDLGTTQIYTHLTKPDLQRVHRRFHGHGVTK